MYLQQNISSEANFRVIRFFKEVTGKVSSMISLAKPSNMSKIHSNRIGARIQL